MPDYKAPIKDYLFLFNDVLDMQGHYQNVDNGDQVTPDMLEAIFSECGRFCENELSPLYQVGGEGCVWQDGEVTTPRGFKEAYATYIESGWTSLTGPSEYGGQDLPPSIGIVVNEMLCTANWAWSMFPGLSEGAIATLESHGTDEQKRIYLQKLLKGTWSGTMCLTEPQCGSDLSQIATKAEPKEGNSYHITGTKIFISAGEHDLTENIVHVVLARLPDAPEGTKGISLFLVPKFLPTKEGGIGERNDVHCGSLEQKMGIHGNPTAVLNFDGACGYLIGEPNEGLAAMFTYMNVARIGTGGQGVAAAELSYQNAVSYAKERLAMRSLSGDKNPQGPADPIIVHPDVRRMLLTQRVIAEGGRAMMGYASKYADIYRSGKTVEERAQAEDYLGFCTPILKAFLTEQGFHATSLGMQVFGGHGYIKEWGMEQILRDSRIAMLYEGTTGIQSLDLVGRKLLMDKFKLLNKFTGEMLEFSQQFLPWKKHPQFKQMWKRAGTIAYIAMQWRYLALRLGQRAKKDREAVGAGALDFLMFSGYAYMAFMWAKMEAQAYKMLAHEDGDEDFLQTKINSAEFFFERILPSAKTHASNVTASVESLMIIPKEQFSRT